MKIVGIDVGGAYSTAFLLEGERPRDLKSFVQSKEFKPFKIYHREEDLRKLTDLKADFVVMEPTGFHYEALIVNWCEKHGQPWKRVVGSRIAAYRKSLGLPKTDGRDALAIACYAIEFAQDERAFIDPCQLADLRKMWIERDNLQRVRGGLINRLRQQLRHEFPEVAEINLERKWGKPCPSLIRWMVEDETLAKNFVTRYRNLHEAGTWKNTANGKLTQTPGTIGTGLGRYARLLAKQIWEADRMSEAHEQEMEAYMQRSEFAKYVEAFDAIGFSRNVRAIWLTRIYPIDRFLSDGKPLRVKRTSKSGKPVTAHISLSKFKAALGAATEPHTSGIRGEVETKYHHRRREVEKMPMGDKLCRRAFVMWASRQLECGKLEPKTEAARKLIEKHAQLKSQGTKRWQRLCNLHGFAAKLLFQLLT